MMGTAEATHEKSPTQPQASQGLSNFGRLCGAVGLVLLVSSPLTWLLTAEFGPLVWGKLIIGSFLVGVYLFTNADFFARMAGSRSTGLFAMSATTVMLVLALVAAGNYLAFKHPKEFDLTQEGLYTLSEQTVGLLKRLDTEVQVTAFFANFDAQYSMVNESLERYAHLNPRVQVNMVDPQTRPDLVEKYQITERGPRIVVSARGQDARVKEPSEQELTYAIIKVAEQTSKKVYFLTGHGEASTQEAEQAEGAKALSDAVAAEGYGVAELNLQTGGAAAAGTKLSVKNDAPAAKLQVPEDAAAVLILGPRRKILDPEVAALEAYADHGGRILAFLEPHVISGLEPLLAQWKIALQNDLVVDTNPLNRLLGLGAAAPMLQPAPGEHAIVKDLNAPAVMLTARSMQVAPGGAGGVDAQPLMRTGDTAWGETNVGTDGTAAKDDTDNAPPLDVAIAASKDQGRIIVFGDSDWVTNRYLPLQGNQDLVLNAINWAAELEQKITIRPKARATSQLFLSGEQLGKLKFFSMDILPVLMVAMGLGIVLVRRQR